MTLKNPLTDKFKTNTSTSSERNANVYSFMSHHPICVLCMVGEDNMPHSVVVYYSVDQEFNITFTTKSETKKVKSLDNNQNVQIVVYEPSLQTLVQVTGVATKITDKEKMGGVLRRTKNSAEHLSISGVAPIEKLLAGEHVMYLVRPSLISMAVFARPDSGGYDDIYEKINFD